MATPTPSLRAKADVPPAKPTARWVNIVLGNVKRALDGAYYAFGFAT